ncbi:hypothetical protein COY07_01665 [Candidatus Peregrinibacteria bacterium CG_4_10_14_0_2_um_filter_43_11]|nr:MAG: hypothetical protein COY07_01665 [Candidatus Peregrinibacteria bacterium CG_4_10_14_0_2_um_filter_43_11]
MKKSLLSFIGIISFFILSACSVQTPSQVSDEQLQIVTTFPPLYSFVVNVVGDKAHVINLLPPGVSIHTWEPKPSDMRALSSADVLVMNGLELEHFAENMIDAVGNPNLEIIVTSDAVQEDLSESGGLIELDPAAEEHDADNDHEHGGMDPHIWLDPLLAVKQVKWIRDRLSAVTPENAGIYNRNASDYVARLQTLDQNIKNQFAAVTFKPFIVFHDAYSYFLRRYGLMGYKKSAIEPFPGKEPSLVYFKGLVDLIRDYGVTLVFTEPQFSPKVVDSLQKEFNALRAYGLDPIGLEVSADAYEKALQKTADTFVRAFFE